jgi:hypothetical protein
MATRRPPRHVNGYPKLARYIGASPEVAIFRRFGALNAQNLLYLQAELVHLEKKLYELEERDSQSSEGMKSRYARDWFWLSRSENDGNDDQWQTVLAIRKKLVEYSKPPSICVNAMLGDALALTSSRQSCRAPKDPSIATNTQKRGPGKHPIMAGAPNDGQLESFGPRQRYLGINVEPRSFQSAAGKILQ